MCLPKIRYVIFIVCNLQVAYVYITKAIARRRQFPTLLLSDSTFNVIDVEKLRLLNFASVTCTGLWFIIGVGFMMGDMVSEVDFIWQLTMLKVIVHENNPRFDPSGFYFLIYIYL